MNRSHSNHGARQTFILRAVSRRLGRRRQILFHRFSIRQLSAHLGRLILLAVFTIATGSSDAQIVNLPPVPEWIQGSESPEAFTIFHKTFQAPEGLLKSIFLGASPGTCSVRINDQSVGEFAGRERATSLDVTAWIRPGTNLLTLRVKQTNGAPTVAALLELNGDLARQQWVASDATWTSTAGDSIGNSIPKKATERPVHCLAHVPGAENPFDPKNAFDAYNSWKLALGNAAASDPAHFSTRPGFVVSLIRSAKPEEGSWISMAFDPQRRLTIAREKRGLLRLSFDSANAVPRVEVIDDTLLECRGLLYAFDQLFANANNSKGLYSLLGPGMFRPKEILHTEGGVGHGRNHIKLGPDQHLYLAHGNNVLLATNLFPESPLRGYADDQLIPCPWDSSMFDGDVRLPAGHILRLDPQGRQVQLWAGGFRNPLDVAFNQDGEMFTFDADMEWDVGAPWYMPNRVLHVVSGADFGFRHGTGRFPAHYADTLPSVVDIGLASPTAVIFGTGAKFPPKYQRAMFICDWAYGRILAIHLRPRGASYEGVSELFLSGRPLNVTDACIGPDGAMWFITGGRGTQSGLYRVQYSDRIESPAETTTEPNDTPAEVAAARQAASDRALRHQLERLHGVIAPGGTAQALLEIWPHLASSDRFIGHAARVALENIPVQTWRDRALAEPSESRALPALLALSRVGSSTDAEGVLTRLRQLPFSALSTDQQRATLRTYALAFIRLTPSPDQRIAARSTLEPLYPASDPRLNPELCRLLVFCESPLILTKTLPLLTTATSSEDLLQYAFLLRSVKSGWTREFRSTVLTALARAELMPGARQYFKAVRDLRQEIISQLSAEDRTALASFVTASRPRVSTGQIPAIVIKEWTLPDFANRLSDAGSGRSFTNGRAAILHAQCTACHQVGGAPGVPAAQVGPDLTAVASRFGRRDLLEQILDPSKIIDEKFRQIRFSLRDGTELTGTIENENTAQVTIRPNPLAEQLMTLRLDQIVRRTASVISPMPTGLLNALTAEEILDLLAFLESGGNPKSAQFQPAPR